MHQDEESSLTNESPVTINKQFGDRMRELREARDLSQRHLAELLRSVGLRLDPSAITRIERGTRDIKLAEAIAIASVLEFDLDGISFSPEEHFRMREFSLVEATIRARKALLDALRSVDRWVNNTDPDTEAHLIEKRALSGVVELYTAMLKTVPAFKSGGRLGFTEGDNWTPYYNDDDRAVKQAIVDAVVNDVLVSEQFAQSLLLKADEAAQQIAVVRARLAPKEQGDAEA